jgi:hypothetical protein
LVKYCSLRIFLKSALNGPQYEMKAEALATLPTRRLLVSLNSLELAIHLTLLSARELISLLA